LNVIVQPGGKGEDRQRRYHGWSVVFVSGPQGGRKHAGRAMIVPLSADGVGTNETMQRPEKLKARVWRGEERFVTAGVTSSYATRRVPLAIALFVDEKSQVQALDRTQRGLTLSKGRATR
jgi:hypothetical protein